MRALEKSILLAFSFSLLWSCSSVKLTNPEAPLAFDPVGTYHLVPIKDWEPAQKFGVRVSMNGVTEFRREADGSLSFTLVILRVADGVVSEMRYSATDDTGILTSADEILITDVRLVGTGPDGTRVPYFGTTKLIFRKTAEGLYFDAGRNFWGPDFYFRRIEPAPELKRGRPPTFRGSVFLVDPPAGRISIVGEKIDERLGKGSTIAIVRKGKIVARCTVVELYSNRIIASTGSASMVQPRDEAFGWK